MLHDIAPHVYSNAFHPHPARLEDKTLCFAQGGVYLREDGSFPLRRDYPAEAEVLYLFDYDGAGVYLSRRRPWAARCAPCAPCASSPSRTPSWAERRSTSPTGMG